MSGGPVRDWGPSRRSRDSRNIGTGEDQPVHPLSNVPPFRYHVAALDRQSFGRIGAEGKHFLRLSIATGIDDLREAVERIGQATLDSEGFAEFLNSGDPLF